MRIATAVRAGLMGALLLTLAMGAVSCSDGSPTNAAVSSGSSGGSPSPGSGSGNTIVGGVG